MIGGPLDVSKISPYRDRDEGEETRIKATSSGRRVDGETKELRRQSVRVFMRGKCPGAEGRRNDGFLQ